jgi:hypothetical protein
MPIRPIALAAAIWLAASPTLARPAASAGGQTPASLAQPAPEGRTLESFAAAMGVRLGGANDQAVFDAAEAAMKASPSGLYVKIAPGRYRLNRIRFGSNSGFYAEAPQTVILQQVRDDASAADEAFVALDDPYATNWLFWGLILDGGWRYGRGAYAKAPETDPWLDHQHGVEFVNAPNGVDDNHYRANSPLGAQNPRGRYGELTIGNFGGDGLRTKGGGDDMVSVVSVNNVGGRGVQWRAYDNEIGLMDVGATGREGFYCGPNCSSNRFGQLKIWYTGLRRLPGASAGLVLDRADDNQFLGLEVQDPAGDAVVLDRAGFNTIIGSVQWQGQIPWMEPKIAVLTLKGAATNRVTLTASRPAYADQAYPAVRMLIQALPSPEAGKVKSNIIDILSLGLPKTLAGPLDSSNTVTIDGRLRTARP